MVRWLAAMLPRGRAPSPRERALRELERGDPAKAESLLDPLVASPAASAAERAFLQNKRGVARMRCGRVEAAAEDFRAAIALDPACAPALVNLGNVALESDRPEEALRRYQEAMAADVTCARAYEGASAAYKRLGRYDDAVKSWRNARRLSARSIFSVVLRRS